MERKMRDGDVRCFLLAFVYVFTLATIGLQRPALFLSNRSPGRLLGGIDDEQAMEPKVFGVGLSETGETSMGKAFEMLGYTTLHVDRKFGHFMHHSNETAFLKGRYDHVDSVWGTPTSGYYKELYSAYPDAKYVLTTRDSKSWYKTIEEYVNGYLMPKWHCNVPIRVRRLHSKVYGSPLPSTDWIDAYERHNADVKSFFAKHAPGQLLVIDIDESDKWEKVCQFIDRHDGPCRDHHYETAEASWAPNLRRLLPKEKTEFPNSNLSPNEDFGFHREEGKETCSESKAVEVVEPKDDDEMKCAYVTILCDVPTVDQIRMLLVMKENIRQYDTESDIVLMVYSAIPAELWKLLKKVGFTLTRITTIGKKVEGDPHGDDESACHRAKVHFLRLTEYDRILFLENEVLLNAGLAVIFDEQASSSSFVAYDAYEEPINGGVLSVRPSEQAFSDISDIIRSGSFNHQNGWLEYGPFPHWEIDGVMSDWSYRGAAVDRGALYYYYDKVVRDASILSRIEGEELFTMFAGQTNKPYHFDRDHLESVGNKYRDAITEWYRLWDRVEARLKGEGTDIRNAVSSVK